MLWAPVSGRLRNERMNRDGGAGGNRQVVPQKRLSASEMSRRIGGPAALRSPMARCCRKRRLNTVNSRVTRDGWTARAAPFAQLRRSGYRRQVHRPSMHLRACLATRAGIRFGPNTQRSYSAFTAVARRGHEAPGVGDFLTRFHRVATRYLLQMQLVVNVKTAPTLPLFRNVSSRAPSATLRVVTLSSPR